MKKIILTQLLLLPLAAMAQTQITFDASPADYKEVGVYDTWEASPFRTGALSGNAKVIKNFTQGKTTGGVDNESDYILGVQRSRFGSNTFGVRIDLNTPWATNESAQYVHVLVYKPNTSKVMLVGLGKRTTSAFADEPTTVEQFWVESNYSYPTANQWTDMVFPVKTVSGVEIYSLVVVPDLKSPHEYTEDFACYVDQIEINSNAGQRSKFSDYYINFDNKANSRDSRYLQGVSLSGPNGLNYSYDLNNISSNYKERNVYNDLTGTVTWDLKAGETYTPAVNYQGNWMHGYAYIDYNQDGQFTPLVGSNHGAAEGSEAVSWSCYNGGTADPLYDSKGNSYSDNNRNNKTMPSFTIPADTKPGIYRMRFKADWNCIDAGGGNENTETSINMQSTADNGGGILDLLINVHSDNVTVNSSARNGYVTLPDGGDITNYSVPFKKEFAISVNPAPGFDNDNIEVKHGYNLDGEQYVHHNRQWQTVTYNAASFGQNGAFTVPAEVVDGDVSITGNFAQKDYVVMDEGEALSALGTDIYGKAINVQLRRTLSTTAYNTMVLPFDMTQAQIESAFGTDAKVFSFSNTSGIEVLFTTSTTGTKANVPFLLTTPTASGTFYIDNVTPVQSATPVAEGTTYNFTGNYDGKITLDEGIWFLNNNTFYRSTGKSTLRGYRAYFTANDDNAKANAPRFYVDGVATDIKKVFTDAPDDGNVYNLGGQRVGSSADAGVPQGVYIKENKKVVVK